jgi:hypothetical protein
VFVKIKNAKGGARFFGTKKALFCAKVKSSISPQMAFP